MRATAINEEMKLAATRALAALAKEDVPDSVCRAYGVERLKFGPEYLIPKPFDPRVLLWEAVAVAKAAMESGVAQEPLDLNVYREQLEKRLGKAHEVARMMVHKAQTLPKTVVSLRATTKRFCAPVTRWSKKTSRFRSCWEMPPPFAGTSANSAWT